MSTGCSNKRAEELSKEALRQELHSIYEELAGQNGEYATDAAKRTRALMLEEELKGMDECK